MATYEVDVTFTVDAEVETVAEHLVLLPLEDVDLAYEVMDIREVNVQGK